MSESKQVVGEKSGRELSLSLKKAMLVLRCFTHDEPTLTLATIVARTKIPRTICYRLLSTFEDDGVIGRDEVTNKYFLTISLFEIGSGAPMVSNIVKIATPHLAALSAETRDTVLLCVENRLDATCVARIDGDYPIQQNALVVGRSWPLHVGGAPFCILSYLSDERRERVLSKPLAAFTGHTVTDAEKIRARIEEVRKRGYALGNEDAIEYLIAIGTPIFGKDGQIAGALSVGGITQRYPPPRILEVAAIAIETADRISAELEAA